MISAKASFINHKGEHSHAMTVEMPEACWDSQEGVKVDILPYTK